MAEVDNNFFFKYHIVGTDPESNRKIIVEMGITNTPNTSAGGHLAYEGIIRPVVSVSALTWFIRYIYYWNLHFLHNVIINKTMILLPQTYVT